MKHCVGASDGALWIIDRPPGREGTIALAQMQGTDADALAHAYRFAAASDMACSLAALLRPYEHLTDEALIAGVLMEHGPPNPERGAIILAARAVLADARGPQ